jgi:hypothetical protein
VLPLLNVSVSARELKERDDLAIKQPHRKKVPESEREKREAESPLGRLLLNKKISQAEYDAGCRWRDIYFNWLRSIGAPNPFPRAVDLNNSDFQRPYNSNFIDDERAEAITKAFRIGERTLKNLGRRVFDSVNAIAVYEEPEELGDFNSTALAAKKGLAALAEIFG